jgi:ATP-dependent DNA helicase RecG
MNRYQDEGHHFDRKSLRIVMGKTANWPELAKDCVAFANASGGELHLGVEDGERLPPADQRIPPSISDQVRKRVKELTVNVSVELAVRDCENGGQVLSVLVPRSTAVASTTEGRYFLRIGDSSTPLVGDDVMRLADERPGMAWEANTAARIPVAEADPKAVERLLAELRASDRVKAAVKEQSDAELLDHYALSRGGLLTNLGVLMVGRRMHRAQLGTAPLVLGFRYDAQRRKIGTLAWDDNALSPTELIDAIWAEVPDFRESYELPAGMFRPRIPAFEEAVIREVLVNALVHRPYTTRGDLFLNLHPDRLEVVNPGRLPIGVTPANILQQSKRRNVAMARLFHDLGRMEREGTGFDLMYEKLLGSGRRAPTVREEYDAVCVTVPRVILHEGVIRLLTEADQRYQLLQRERITLGLLAQGEGMRADELSAALGLTDNERVQSWIGRLAELGLVATAGRTRGTRYFVPPELLRGTGLPLRTTLTRVEPHRLRALILEDLGRYPGSSRPDVHGRIAPELDFGKVRRAFEQLLAEGKVLSEGSTKRRRYRLSTPERNAR